ncbi:MAG: enediyne biosynthesis protein UnbU [Saccharothrix sp.]|nr:enediyne biosynthesis protein UnbU [Saccharothrix sp.]
MTATRIDSTALDGRELTTPAPPAAAPDQRRVKALTRFAVSITVFNILGHAFLGFEQAPITPLVAVLTSYAAALAFESLDAWAYGRRPVFAQGRREFAVFLLPAHITGLATGMLLWGNSSLWPYLFAILIGNGSKYVVRLRVRGRLRHVLNPSNTGIAVTLLLFPWVGIAPPYHFTSFTSGAIDWLLPLAVLTAGTVINAKLTGRMPLIAGWLGAFAAQAVLRWAVLDHDLIAALAPMTGLAFVLFTNYMITDPATTPTTTRNQVVFGMTAAAVYGVLVVSGVSFGLFFALVITCAARGLAQLLAAGLRGARGATP